MADQQRHLSIGIHEIVIRIRRDGVRGGFSIDVEHPACVCGDAPPIEITNLILAALDSAITALGGVAEDSEIRSFTADGAPEPTQNPGRA